MKKAAKPRPPLTGEASEHAAKLSELFHDRLKCIAEELAQANGGENVQRRDINIALLALKRAGMEEPPPPRRFFQMPSFWIGLGTLLCGLSPSIAGFAVAVIKREDHPYWYAGAVMIGPTAIGVGGAVLALIGWISDKD